jgi:hypothetical protein
VERTGLLFGSPSVPVGLAHAVLRKAEERGTRAILREHPECPARARARAQLLYSALSILGSLFPPVTVHPEFMLLSIKVKSLSVTRYELYPPKFHQISVYVIHMASIMA